MWSSKESPGATNPSGRSTYGPVLPSLISSKNCWKSTWLCNRMLVFKWKCCIRENRYECCKQA